MDGGAEVMSTGNRFFPRFIHRLARHIDDSPVEEKNSIFFGLFFGSFSPGLSTVRKSLRAKGFRDLGSKTALIHSFLRSLYLGGCVYLNHYILCFGA